MINTKYGPAVLQLSRIVYGSNQSVEFEVGEMNNRCDDPENLHWGNSFRGYMEVKTR